MHKNKQLIASGITIILLVLFGSSMALLQTARNYKQTNNGQPAIQKKMPIGNIGTPILRVDTFKLSASTYGKPDTIIYQQVLSSLRQYEGIYKEITDITSALNKHVRKVENTYYVILADGLYIQDNNSLEKVELPSVNTETLGWKNRTNTTEVAKDNLSPDKILVTTDKEIIVYNSDAYTNYYLVNQKQSGDIGIWYSVISWKYLPSTKTFELQQNEEGNFNLSQHFNEDTSYLVDNEALGHLLRSYSQQYVTDLNQLSIKTQDKIYSTLTASYKVNDNYILNDFAFLDAMTIKWLIHKSENKQVQAIIKDLYFSDYSKGLQPEIMIIDSETLKFKLYPTSSGKDRYNKSEYNLEYSIKTGNVYLTE